MTVKTTDLPIPSPPEPIPPLRHGDRLSRAEFERRYHAMPEVNKAELLEGVVYMPSPVSEFHGNPHFRLIGWLARFEETTPGVIGSDNGSVRLGSDSEPQPDAILRIEEAHGGGSRLSADHLIEGPPELVAEVAVSSISVDRNVKLPIYRRHGVRECILWRVPDKAIDWFVLRGEEYELLAPGADGVLRSEVLPGLWLDAAALIRGDLPTMSRIAQEGIASREHAAFVQRLAEAARR
jgi:Uma2 family endonuclease